MDLTMYEFDFGGAVTWVVAHTQEQAVDLFVDMVEELTDEEKEAVNEEVRTLAPDETFNFYPDGVTRERDAVENLIRRYADKPGFFANSEF